MNLRYCSLLFGSVILLLAAGLLTACGNDDPGTLSEPVPAQFSGSIGADASRASGTEWAADDAIGISGVSGAKSYTNVKHTTASGDGKFTTAGDAIYYQNADAVTFTAYYPYAASLGSDGLITASTADQSQQPSFDFLWAQAEGSQTAPGVKFNFSHRMSRIDLTFTASHGVDLSGLTFAISGLRLEGTFNTSTGEANASGNPSQLSCTPEGSTADRATASLILFPQSADGAELTVRAANTDFAAAFPIPNLEASLNYRVKVTVSPQGIEVSEVTGGTWVEGGEAENITSKEVVTKYTAEQLKIGDYVYTDGTFSDGGLRYLLSDGTFGTAPVAPVTGKTPVGIVFHLRNSSSPEDDCDYTELDEQIPTGYIVSLDQNNGPFANENPAQNDQAYDGNINGYKYTKGYYNKYHESYSLYAIEWCMNHTTIPATTNYAFSSWYLPSIQELILMRGESNGNAPVFELLKANTELASGAKFTDKDYMTCQFFGNMGLYVWSYNLSNGEKPGVETILPRDYRAVCAFRKK